MAPTRKTLMLLLHQIVELGATELHFKVPAPPLMRVDGRLVPARLPALRPADVHELLGHLCGLAEREIPLASVQDTEFAFGLHGIGRFLVTIYRQRGSLAAQVRHVRIAPPTLADLGMGAELEGATFGPGLVTLAGNQSLELMHALVSEYNAKQRGHVVLLESPLAYLHRDSAATIAQREVGVDVVDHVAGIRAAVTVGTDLLAIGDITEPAAVEAALAAAERGLTVLVATGAPTAELASWWLTRMFFGEHRQVVERRLELVHRDTIALCSSRLQLLRHDPVLRCAM